MKPSLALPCLCLVTDRARSLSGVVDVVAAAVDAGVGMVQLREKDYPAGKLLSLARELRAVTEGRCIFIVNDRVDVATLSEADGIQLGESSLDVISARRLVGDDMLIGRSVHSTEGAIEAEASGADFLILGTIFNTASHPGARTGGLDLVREVSSAVGIPTICIGGITESNIGELVKAGAAGAAVISAISMALYPGVASSRLSATMRRAHSSYAEMKE